MFNYDGFFLTNVVNGGGIKIQKDLSKTIIDFSLYNFDNLIADHFEDQSPYINQLVQLIHRGTQLPTTNITAIILAQDISENDTPPSYMLRLNRDLKRNTGFYFIDD